MSDSAATPGPETSQRSINGWQQLWAASGVLTVVLFACGLLFGDVLGTNDFPPLDATASRVRSYFLENASEV